MSTAVQYTNMKYHRVIPARAVIALIMNVLILAWIVSELTGKTSYADIVLILVAIAGFAGSTVAVVHEIKQVKRRGKCTYAVRAECTDVQERADISESSDEVPVCLVKWKYTVFGKEYEVRDEKYTGGKPQIGCVNDMFVNPDDPNEFFYDTKPRRMVVIIGFISGVALTAAVCILIFT